MYDLTAFFSMKGQAGSCHKDGGWVTELSGEFSRQQHEGRGDDEARSEHKARSLLWRQLGKGWEEEPATCVDRSCCHKTQAGN